MTAVITRGRGLMAADKNGTGLHHDPPTVAVVVFGVGKLVAEGGGLLLARMAILPKIQ
jgi:hypothetical protein